MVQVRAEGLKGQKQHALKGQKLLAQGIALGIVAVSKAPCKGKSFVIFAWGFKAFALTGRQVCVRNYPGRCPGLGASALSGRVGKTCESSVDNKIKNEEFHRNNLMETERILLRYWQKSDAEALFKYASDPDVGPRAGWPAHKSVEESREIIRTFFHNETTWAIVLKETGEAIGCIGYYTHETSNIPIGENDCEVGYWVGKPFWNQGICTEALKLMLDYCINEKHFENIWADHFTGNPASGRVMEKCGFSDTGMLNRCSQLVGGDKEMVKVFKYNG